MERTTVWSAILCAVTLLLLLPAVAGSAPEFVDVSTVEELRAALENNTGAQVRLTDDIAFTTANAADRDFGVYLGDGCYTVDLNGHTLRYHYMTGGEFSDRGVPVVNTKARLLVINGPGSLIGGTHGLEQQNQFGTLIVNGGTIKGVMGFGIRGGGLVCVNGGTVAGNFGSIEYERGIVVLNGGDAKSVVHNPWDKKTTERYGVIRNGAFTGNAVLEGVVLDVPDLTISQGSSITVRRDGGLIVRNSFVNNGTLTYESGLKSIGGDATIKPDLQGDHTPVNVLFDMSLSSLDIQERAALRIGNGATVTVTGAFSTGTNSSVEAENGTLRLLGSIDHKGRADGVPDLAGLEDHGGGPGHGPRDSMAATSAAERLKALGLFQGVGTKPDGSTDFDLARAPSRTEALVMLIRLLGKEDEALSGDWRHPFTDVPAWADKYVGYAYENGLTRGVSAREFGTGQASSQMYLTFVLRALGYSDTGGADFTWDRPEALALSAGIMPEDARTQNFLRADVVLVSEAALSAKLKDSRDTLLDKLIADGAVIGP